MCDIAYISCSPQFYSNALTCFQVNEQKVRNMLFGGQRIILRFPSSVKASKPGKCDSISAKGSLASAKLNLPIDIPDQPETEIDLDLSAKLYTALRMLRTTLCREAGEGVMAHHIFGNATLQQISKKLPRTKEELLDINGISKTKVSKYGDRLLETIAKTINEYYNTDKNSSGSKGSVDSAKRRREANRTPDSNGEDDDALIKSTGRSKKRTVKRQIKKAEIYESEEEDYYHGCLDEDLDCIDIDNVVLDKLTGTNAAGRVLPQWTAS